VKYKWFNKVKETQYFKYVILKRLPPRQPGGNQEQFHEERIMIGLNSIVIIIIAVFVVLFVFHMCAVYCPLLFVCMPCCYCYWPFGC
jgi:hypothetical protein